MGTREIKFRAWVRNHHNPEYEKWLKTAIYDPNIGSYDKYERETGKSFAAGFVSAMEYNPHANDEWLGETQPLNPVIEAIQEQGDFLMQYTGLKDKNGREIYEGDIIEKTQYDKPTHNPKKKPCQVRYVVEWWEQKHQDNDHNNKILADDPSAFSQDPGFRAQQLDYENTKKFGHHSWSPFSTCEVIGNIYENPELLQ